MICEKTEHKIDNNLTIDDQENIKVTPNWTEDQTSPRRTTQSIEKMKLKTQFLLTNINVE